MARMEIPECPGAASFLIGGRYSEISWRPRIGRARACLVIAITPQTRFRSASLECHVLGRSLDATMARGVVCALETVGRQRLWYSSQKDGEKEWEILENWLKRHFFS